jgi:hypothetical protein
VPRCTDAGDWRHKAPSRHRAGARPTAPPARTHAGPGSREPMDVRPPQATPQP